LHSKERFFADAAVPMADREKSGFMHLTISMHDFSRLRRSQVSFIYESARIVAEPVKPLLRGCKGLIAPCLFVRGLLFFLTFCRAFGAAESEKKKRCRGRPPSALPLVWQMKQLFQARAKFGLTHTFLCAACGGARGIPE
jgi:hypothetical protein